MKDLVFVAVIVALISFLFYQRKIYLDKIKERFVCHYCNHTFTIEELDRVGKYDYCKKHGLNRQAFNQ